MQPFDEFPPFPSPRARSRRETAAECRLNYDPFLRSSLTLPALYETNEQARANFFAHSRAEFPREPLQLAVPPPRPAVSRRHARIHQRSRRARKASIASAALSFGYSSWIPSSASLIGILLLGGKHSFPRAMRVPLSRLQIAANPRAPLFASSRVRRFQRST